MHDGTVLEMVASARYQKEIEAVRRLREAKRISMKK